MSSASASSDATVALAPHRWFGRLPEWMISIFNRRPVLSSIALASVAGYTALRWVAAGGVCRHRADLTGKVVVITGGHSGIGLETTRILAAMGQPLVILGTLTDTRTKNPDAQSSVVGRLQAQTGNPNIKALKLDLADLESVKAFYDELKGLCEHVDILIENAGVLATERRATKHGFETDFGVNHLGHVYLAYQLMPLLRAAPTEARVIVLSSVAHKSAKLDWDDLQWLTRPYHPAQAYAESKLANVLFVTELNRRLQSDPRSNHITANAVHPGVINSGIARELDNVTKTLNWIILALIGKTPVQGAQTTVHAAVAPTLRGWGGLYLADCAIADRSKEATVNNGIKLWDISCNLLGIPTDW